MSQERLTEPGTVALMRAVMAETSRFPELAEIAYNGFVGHLEEMTEQLLGAKEEAASLGQKQRRKLGAIFVDRLFGSDMFRVLLGLPGASKIEQRERAERATAEVISRIKAMSN